MHALDVPEQAPDQPVKVEFAPAVAVRVTDVPATKLVPDGVFITVPLPEPLVEIANVYVCAAAWLMVMIVPATVSPAVLDAASVFRVAEY